MKRLTAAALLGLLALGACKPAASPEPTTPHDIIGAYLTKNGYHVVDVSMMVTTGDTGIQTSTTADVSEPTTVCQSAPYGAMFRAYSQDGIQHIGIACLEKDNSITIPLQK